MTRYILKQLRTNWRGPAIKIIIIGNDFYRLWLDRSRTYSCAYFEHGTESLAEAQYKKRELLCRKLRHAATLERWSRNFLVAREQVVKMFDEQFARMRWFYLQGSEAGFRWSDLELWQFELYGSAAALSYSRELNGAKPARQ